MTEQDRHLRVGTPEREHALEVLRNAAAEDRISFDELEDRIPAVVGARTRGDLARVLDDLVPAAELDTVVAARSAASEGPGWTWDQPLVLHSDGLRMLRVVGPWDVPPFVELNYDHRGVFLDFSAARPTTAIIDLVIVGGRYGGVLMLVPEGWGVDTQGIQTDAMSTVNASVQTRPDHGLPRIIVRGRLNGSLTVRTPTERDRRRAEKFRLL